jgi:cytoskeletal protein RodZ
MNKQALQINQLQAISLKEIGLKLLHAREQREFTLEEVSAKTHIPTRSLQAIETGNLEQLPEPVYTQSLIRQYANALGVNGVQLASEFPIEPVVRSLRKSWRPQPKLQLTPVHLYGAYALLIVGAVQGLSVVLNQSAREFPTLPNTPQVPPQARRQPSQVAVGPQLPAKVQPKQSAAQPAKPVRVDLTLTDASWVKFVVDGKQAYEGTIPAGETRVLTADQKVTVVAGNAGGVIATFNGGEAKPLGEPGVVQEVSFPPESDSMASESKQWMAQRN